MTAQLRIRKKFRITGLTRAQQAWLQNYEDTTMLEPLGLTDLAQNPADFAECAQMNIRHFEDWSHEAMSDISTNVPDEDEDKDANHVSE